ncbi:MAG: hypothetical protein ABI947_23055 [Chloroflexota bacterium]
MSVQSPHHDRKVWITYWLRYGGLVLVLLGILWFPFEWLSSVWPAFGSPFRLVFRTTHDHFIGHTVFFLLIGWLILASMPLLRRTVRWYLVGLILAALMQEAVQSIFAGNPPTFTDTNAFMGDALGGISAFVLWSIILLLQQLWHHHRSSPT